METSDAVKAAVPRAQLPELIVRDRSGRVEDGGVVAEVSVHDVRVADAPRPMQIGQHLLIHHALHFAGHTGHGHYDLTIFQLQANTWRGANRIGNRFSPLRQIGLSQIIFTRLASPTGKYLFNTFD